MRWNYETTEDMETVKEFYEKSYPSDKYSIAVAIYLADKSRPSDILSIIVNFKSDDETNAGEAFSLSMIDQTVTIEETKTFAPDMKWPE